MAKTFTKLTRRAMRQLAPGEQINEHGIIFERLANGDGVFRINIMIERQRIHRVVGRESNGVTRLQAEAAAQKFRQDALHDRLSLPRGRKMPLKFQTAATQYLERLREEVGRDVVAKERRLRLHLRPFFGDTPLAGISSFHVERYKKNRLEEGAHVGTINRELAALSHLFSKSMEWGWLDKRPKIRRFKESQGRIVYLTVEQIQRLLEAAEQDANPQILVFMTVALETAMRKMEILTMRREHIDVPRRLVYIPRAKAGPREQPITEHLAHFLAEMLAQLPADSAWLFPSPTSQTGHTVSVQEAFLRTVARAGLDPQQVTPHTLRHTAITHLVQSGVDLPTVMRISGHRSLTVVARYAHQNGSHIEAAMDKLQERYAMGTPSAGTITPELHTETDRALDQAPRKTASHLYS
jgi:integrase